MKKRKYLENLLDESPCGGLSQLLGVGDDPSPSSQIISTPLAPLWLIYTCFMDHDMIRGSREYLYVARIIIGIGGKEYGLVSEIRRVCIACDCESTAL